MNRALDHDTEQALVASDATHRRYAETLVYMDMDKAALRGRPLERVEGSEARRLSRERVEGMGKAALS